MRVTIIGTGYVGLVTGACLAHLGHQVICMDTDEAKIRLLRTGKLPIYEPGLDELVATETAAGRLSFADRYDVAIPGAEAVFICVGTPSLPSGQADMSYVAAAARSLGEHLGGEYCVIINKSTVPIGSGDWVGMLVRQGVAYRSPVTVGAEETRSGATAVAVGPRYEATFDIVSNPEFLREGTAISDALYPDRVVIGAENVHAVDRMRQLYAPLLARAAACGHEIPFIVTDRTSAEMIKYAANAFLATKISFINEIGNICERVGADVLEVARGIGLDHRIGNSFLSAGIGWGGSCFPKDLASLVHTGHEYGYEARLLASVREVNEAQRGLLIRKLQERLKLIKGKTIGLWGLAFKPGTDDLRDAPALELVERLAELGAEVQAYDPQAMEAASRRGIKAQLCPCPYSAARNTDALILITEWDEFRQIDWSRLYQEMRRPLVVDGRNALDRVRLLWHGFEYCGIGR